MAVGVLALGRPEGGSTDGIIGAKDSAPTAAEAGRRRGVARCGWLVRRRRPDDCEALAKRLPLFELVRCGANLDPHRIDFHAPVQAHPGRNTFLPVNPAFSRGDRAFKQLPVHVSQICIQNGQIGTLSALVPALVVHWPLIVVTAARSTSRWGWRGTCVSAIVASASASTSASASAAASAFASSSASLSSSSMVRRVFHTTAAPGTKHNVAGRGNHVTLVRRLQMAKPVLETAQSGDKASAACDDRKTRLAVEMAVAGQVGVVQNVRVEMSVAFLVAALRHFEGAVPMRGPNDVVVLGHTCGKHPRVQVIHRSDRSGVGPVGRRKRKVVVWLAVVGAVPTVPHRDPKPEQLRSGKM